jgi:RNA polymerase sigma factor (sigma-70 family)
MGVSTRGRFGFLARLGPPPPADSDADLLDRYTRAADGAAFAAIVRRHGPMVMAVCRRRLGRDADAEDAFQAVFLALATSAAAVRRRESLPGWLYRAAYLTALKAAGRRGRRPTAPLPDEVPMPDPPLPAWEAEEVRAAVDAEVAGLPDKLRAVVVLCLLEGHTNAEAAATLGVPAGTVDSRLHAARKTLQARLTRRGVAVGLGLTLEHLLGGPVAAAGPQLSGLVSDTVSAVLAEAARPGAGAVSPAVADLARGVSVMATNVRALAALGLALGVLGTTGAGVFLAAAPDTTRPALAAADGQPPPPAAKAPDNPPKAAVIEADGPPARVKGTTVLDEEFGVPLVADGSTTTLSELLDAIAQKTKLIVRVDVAAFRRSGAFNEDADPTVLKGVIKQIYEAHPILPTRGVERMPIRDVLTDALAQVHLPQISCTYQVRGSQLVIVPAYRWSHTPGVNPLQPGETDEVGILELKMQNEQIYGGVVVVSADRKPLADILADLRRQTGANIVLDPRCEAVEKKANLTVSLNDVRLYDALRVLADMSDLRMVYAGNIYYVTTPANARSFQSGLPRTNVPAAPSPPTP